MDDLTADLEAFAEPEWLAVAPESAQLEDGPGAPDWLSLPCEATAVADLATMDSAVRHGVLVEPGWLDEPAPAAPEAASEVTLEPEWLGSLGSQKEPSWLGSQEEPVWLGSQEEPSSASTAIPDAQEPVWLAQPAPKSPAPASAQAEASLAAILEEISTSVAQRRRIDSAIPANKSRSHSASAAQYVVFYLSSTRFALPIDAVIEVSTVPRITHLPRIPHYVRGVANLRGEILPVLDLRSLLGFPRQTNTILERMLVLRSQEHDIAAGFIVDRLRGLARLDAAALSQPEGPIEDAVTRFIEGVTENEQQVLNVLNPDRIFQSEEFRRLSQQ